VKDNWETKLGSKAIVSDKKLFNLIRTQKLMDEDIIHDITYGYIGIVQHENETPYYVDNGGRISKDGHDQKVCSSLNGKLKNFRLPEPTTDLKFLKKCISACFEFEKISLSNPYLGILAIMAPVLALLSIFIDVSLSFFLVGGTGSRKSSFAAVLQAFFGAGFSDKSQLPLSWVSTGNALEAIIILIKNALLVIDEYTPRKNINMQELTEKAERVFRGLANNMVRHRCNSDGTTEQISAPGAFVMATGEVVPQNVDESLLNRILFFNISKSDIDNAQLSVCQERAAKGMYAQVAASMIQYVLEKYDFLTSRLPKEFLKYRDEAATLLKGIDNDMHDRCPENMALMMTAMFFFYRFAMKKKVITEEEFNQHCAKAWNNLTALILDQKLIFSGTNASELFFNDLSSALNDGKVHLLDYQTGGPPQVSKPRVVGWAGKKPLGQFIGWLDAKNGDVYISNKIDIKVLLDLMTESTRLALPSTEKSFWIAIKNSHGLASFGNGSNRLKKTDPKTKTSIYVRHLSIKLPINSV
jgi:hypothetical protein